MMKFLHKTVIMILKIGSVVHRKPEGNEANYAYSGKKSPLISIILKFQ